MRKCPTKQSQGKWTKFIVKFCMVWKDNLPTRGESGDLLKANLVYLRSESISFVLPNVLSVFLSHKYQLNEKKFLKYHALSARKETYLFIESLHWPRILVLRPKRNICHSVSISVLADPILSF
ncbi:hypothetical protein RRG08_015951 [Elysia crispata]|uniref:Uncharacterized protein n=1 Tax=Elysia crispata TaxID=231223 RepID=A0AAE1APL9_9GAST|nr:hypothetical protein RRG08_015951 [Elysia crispata]